MKKSRDPEQAAKQTDVKDAGGPEEDRQRAEEDEQEEPEQEEPEKEQPVLTYIERILLGSAIILLGGVLAVNAIVLRRVPPVLTYSEIPSQSAAESSASAPNPNQNHAFPNNGAVASSAVGPSDSMQSSRLEPSAEQSSSFEPSISTASKRQNRPSETQNPANNGTVGLNSATLEELMTLDGIGEVKAQAILDYRAEHGPFQSIDALLEVKGIGEKTLEKNRSRLTLD